MSSLFYNSFLIPYKLSHNRTLLFCRLMCVLRSIFTKILIYYIMIVAILLRTINIKTRF